MDYPEQEAHSAYMHFHALDGSTLNDSIKENSNDN